MEEDVVISLLYALATKAQPLLHEDASEVLIRLTDVLGLPGLATLYQRHFASVLEGLIREEGYRKWRSDSPERALFEVLLRAHKM